LKVEQLSIKHQSQTLTIALRHFWQQKDCVVDDSQLSRVLSEKIYGKRAKLKLNFISYNTTAKRTFTSGVMNKDADEDWSPMGNIVTRRILT
jgi:hypothetical protein